MHIKPYIIRNNKDVVYQALHNTEMIRTLHIKPCKIRNTRTLHIKPYESYIIGNTKNVAYKSLHNKDYHGRYI